MALGLKAPQNLKIDFAPSERQYELWKLLQPDYCPHCGGHIIQVEDGYDMKGNLKYKPQCANCGSQDLPQLILGGGAAGGGKAGLLDSKILTPFGYRHLKDIKVGDIITSPTTGGMQKVIYLHPIDVFDFYRVKFRDGTYFDCSEGHLWQVHQSKKHKSKKTQKYNISPDVVMPTIDMYKWYEKKREGMYKGQHLIIPLTEPVKFSFGDKGNHYIDPYVMGAIIGDGCITDIVIDSGYVQFTTMDQEIVDRFVECGYDMSNKRPAGSRAYNYRILSKTLIECLKKYGMAGNSSKTHFIPKVYKYGTIEERIRLMQGLMDTDGYVDDRGHMSYTTISEQLAEDVAFTIRSLGGAATITNDIGSYKDENGNKIECNKTYTVYFRTKMDPELVHLSRKKKRARYEFNGGASEYGRRIVDIEYLGKKPGRCISVSEPNGLYVVDDFIVTHNSYLGSCWLVSSCIRFPDIRAVVARKTLKSLKGSTFNTIKKVCKEWGLKEGVNYKVNNLDGILTFWNDSVIIMQEMIDLPSDPQFERFGSSEYTIAFVDEVSEISERAIEVLFSRLRWKTVETFKTARMFMSTNPTINWVRSRFVQDDDGNPVKCREGEAYVPFSVFDNPDKAFVQTYVAALNKITDKATKERLLYGNWDWVDSNEAAAYWNFNGEIHLKSNLKEKVYNPLKPLILCWDFNVIPHMSVLAIQIDYERRKLYVLEEILGAAKDKENNTPRLSQKISEKYLNEKHMGGIIITGDPAGKARSTQTEEGVNNYTIILGNLHNPILNVKKQLLSKQPPLITRLEFINELFKGYEGWSIEIDMRCRKLTEDLVYQKKNSDGTKCKSTTTDPKMGVKYEKYGHMSDCLDYAACLFLADAWKHFQSRGFKIQTTNSSPYEGFTY